MKRTFIVLLAACCCAMGFARDSKQPTSYNYQRGVKVITREWDLQTGIEYLNRRIELTNVRASVVANQNAPLLLGQSVLQRLGKIEIDNEKRVIKITAK